MYIIVQTSTNSKKLAQKLAQKLLCEKLAVCVKISKSSSYFLWKEKMCKEKEFILNILSSKPHFKAIENFLKLNHNYEIFECISIKIKDMNVFYEKWLKENIKIKL